MLRQLWIDLRVRIKALFGRRHLRQRASEELATHIAMRQERLVDAGATPAEARTQALREFGNHGLLRETTMDSWPYQTIDRSIGDARYALRTLWRTPSFSLVAVLSLALGVGANGALFGLVDALLLRDLPVKDPDGLVAVAPMMQSTSGTNPLGEVSRGRIGPSSLEALRELPVFAGVAASGFVSPPLVMIDGALEPAPSVLRVTTNFFDVVGVNLAIGQVDGETPEVVLADGYWESRFQRQVPALGRRITVDDRPYTIAGIAPPGFFGVNLDNPVDMWLVEPDGQLGSGASIARLADGITREQAQGVAGAVFRDIFQGLPEGMRIQADVTPAGKGFSSLRNQYQRPLLALTVLVGLVLLVTCTNIGHLLVGRNTERRTELLLRTALGAGQSRLMAQIVIESLVLAALGCALAVLVAYGVAAAILSMLPVSELPHPLAFRTDLRLLGFLAAVSVVSALLFSVAPAWLATRNRLGDGFNVSHQATVATGQRLDHWLLAGQVLVSVVLLTGSGLFLRTLENIAAIDTGFDGGNLLQAQIEMRFAGYGTDPDEPPARVVSLYRLLLGRLADLPQVEAVTASRNPLLRPEPLAPVEVDGIPGIATMTDVGSQFFQTMGIPLIRGRVFAPEDEVRAMEGTDDDLSEPIVVSESFARWFFPNDDPVGKTISYRGGDGVVAGVVRDAKLSGLLTEDRPRLYSLFLGSPSVLDSFQVRFTGDPGVAAAAVRDVFRDIDPRMLGSVETVGEIERRSIARERMVAAASGFLAMLGLGLAGVGLFGVVSLTVSRRTRELGIRVALGAGPWDVIREVLVPTSRVFLLGLVAGTGAAAAVARVLGTVIEGLLFGLEATDVTNVLTVAFIMTLVAVIACLLPTARALRIDPLRAIRYE